MKINNKIVHLQCILPLLIALSFLSTEVQARQTTDELVEFLEDYINGCVDRNSEADLVFVHHLQIADKVIYINSNVMGEKDHFHLESRYTIRLADLSEKIKLEGSNITFKCTSPGCISSQQNGKKHTLNEMPVLCQNSVRNESLKSVVQGFSYLIRLAGGKASSL